VRYSQDIEAEISQLSAAIAQVPALTEHYSPRWLAIQLLENDESLLAEVKMACGGSARVWQSLTASRGRLARTYGDEVDIALADQRYRFVNDLVRAVVTRPEAPPLNCQIGWTGWQRSILASPFFHPDVGGLQNYTDVAAPWSIGWMG
jgi:ferrous iron transport protein B